MKAQSVLGVARNDLFSLELQTPQTNNCPEAEALMELLSTLMKPTLSRCAGLIDECHGGTFCGTFLAPFATWNHHSQWDVWAQAAGNAECV